MIRNRGNSSAPLSANKKWITFRATPEEKARLAEQADIVGLSVSEYMRRRVWGGRPLIAHTDMLTIRELRRLGDLLKHNFETLRQAGASQELVRCQEEVLRLVIRAMEKIAVTR